MENQINPATNILSTLASTEDASEYLEQIDKFLAAMYQSDRANIQNVLDEMLPENISNGIKEYLSSTNIDLSHQEEVRYALTKLQEFIKQAKVVSLTIAISPSKRMVDKIAQQVKKAFGSDVLTELSINEDIVGGAIIISEGRYIDASVKRKIDILFEAKREEIVKILNSHIAK